MPSSTVQTKTRPAHPTAVSPTAPDRSAKHASSAKKTRRVLRSESAHSDTPTISSGGHSPSPCASKYDLHGAYPSVVFSAKCLRTLKGSEDVDTMGALAKVFSACLQTVIHTIDCLSDQVSGHPDYQFARTALVFSSKQFSAQSKTCGSDTWDTEKKSYVVDMTLDMTEMVISSLVKFLQAAEALRKRPREDKPLPALPKPEVPTIIVTGKSSGPSSPADFHTNTQDLPKRESLAMIVKEVINGNSEDLSGCSSICASSSSPDLLAPRSVKDGSSLKTVSSSKTLAQKSKIIRMILWRLRNASLLSFETSPVARLAEETRSFLEDLHTYTENVSTGNADLAYEPRQSALYFPVNPLDPGNDVEMPPLSKDAMAVRLDSQGQFKAASLTALIRLLTSKDVIADRHLCEMFFFSFRFFLSPREVAQKLIDRYYESMPEGNPDQNIVWTRNQMNIVRPRVLNFIQRWLYEYWLPDIDNATVLELLQTFLLKELPTERIPQQIGNTLLQGVYSAQVGELTRSLFLRQRYELIASGSMIRELEPTGFKLKFKTSEVEQQFLQFNSEAGREELARQLTVKVSALFGALNPEGVVRFWLDQKVHETTQKQELLIKGAVRHIEMKIDELDAQSARSQDRIEKRSLSRQGEVLTQERDEVVQQLIALGLVAEAHCNAVQEAKSQCTAIVRWERSLHLFVIHTILYFENSPSQRINLIYFWWRVCAICLRLNNFSCATTIYVATTNACISRLRETLSLMHRDSEMRSLYAKLNPFFADRKKYGDRMFEILERRTEPVVPCLPSLKRKIEILADAIPLKLAIKPGEPETGINLAPFRTIGETVSSMELAQLPYKLPSDSRIQDWLDIRLRSFNNPLLEEAIMREFDRRSDEVEPRASVPPVVRKMRHDPWTECIRKVNVKGQIEFRVYSLGDPKMPAQVPYTPEDFGPPTLPVIPPSTETPPSTTHLSDKENVPSGIDGSPTSHNSLASPVKRSRAPSLAQRLLKR